MSHFNGKRFLGPYLDVMPEKAMTDAFASQNLTPRSCKASAKSQPTRAYHLAEALAGRASSWLLPYPFERHRLLQGFGSDWEMNSVSQLHTPLKPIHAFLRARSRAKKICDSGQEWLQNAGCQQPSFAFDPQPRLSHYASLKGRKRTDTDLPVMPSTLTSNHLYETRPWAYSDSHVRRARPTD